MPLRMGRGRSWLGTAMAAVAALGATSLAWMPQAGAQASTRDLGETGFYTASARSVFVDGYFTNPTIPGGVKGEGGGPATDVAQSSLNQGDANASFPYFGDVVPTLPGVASGLFGFPVPPYPFTASSNFGGDPTRISYPGIELSAISRATSTVADAVVGSTGAGAVAHSEVDESSTGTVTALARTGSPLTTLGPLVTLKGFESVARVSADANGTLTRSANFVIDEISVPGLVLKIPKQSPSTYPIPFPVPVPGVPAPEPVPAPPIPFPKGGERITEPKIGFQNGMFTISLPFAGEPQKYALPAEPVIQAFAAQGVTLRYTAPQETEHGVLGGVLSVQYDIPAPPDNPVYHDKTPATFIIGDVRAEVERAKAATGGPAGVAPVAVPAAGTISDAALPAAPIAPVLAPIDSPPGLTPAPVPTVDLIPTQDPDSRAVTKLVAAGLPAFVDSDFAGIYLGLVGIAVVAVAAVAVLGAMGVKA